MRFAAILLVFSAFELLATAAPAPMPKNVFRPENIGMGYRGRKTSGPRSFPPFPGHFGKILGPSDVQKVDAVDKVDRVDGVDGMTTPDGMGALSL
ncbi:hypothetical protein FN846DRAFT_923743 [Sphaerosporella brunnea]|uniref:Uncharacterized protein n=1 Tax=Sphaerosporella brunnea TaxID=1250544 RepID=A0A5J5EEC0_9PEZI|nr:hypothetical protein FN846DRAFT_923743 [Sphaerosporella brunnea]